MMRFKSTPVATLGLVILAGACAEAPLPTTPALDRTVVPAEVRSGGRLFHRYVAIGTSISMGVQSDGVFEGTQSASWVAQLAGLAGEQVSLPLIESPGCGSPLVGRLADNKRLSNERPDVGSDRICAPLKAGITLPTANVAVDGARTDDALFSRVGTYSGYRGGQYARVLPPGMSQVEAMLAQNPKFVSVELGGNDIMGARSGLYIPAAGGTVVPLETWKTLYTRVLDAVQSTATRAILVGLIDDALEFPGFRTGQEIWAARETFRLMGVTVTEACGGANSGNVLFVPVIVTNAIATRGTLTCQNAPSLVAASDGRLIPGPVDFTLAPQEIAALNAHLAAMNQHIRSEAAARGWAHVELEVIYGRQEAKPAFNPHALMFSLEPYGPYVSLDGIHPSTAGARILAEAAAAALSQRYRLRIGEPVLAEGDDDIGNE
jgi:lysophospholipase L1-like esterase